MIRNLTALAAGLTAAALLTACGTAQAEPGTTASETRTVAHAQGTTEVPADPQRVFIVDRAALDTADALGIEVAGVSKEAMPEFLTEYTADEIVDVGPQKELDLELIAAEAPDLVIVAGRSAAQYPEVDKIAATVDVTASGPDFLANVTSQSKLLGETFGKSAEVDAALAELDTQVDEARAATEGKGTGLVLMVSGGKISAFGEGSRFGLVHDLGIEPAAGNLTEDPHGQVVSFEFVAETNPDWLFVIDRDAAVGESGGQSAAAVLDNPLVNGTTAARNDQIVFLDAARWYAVGGGLRNASEMIGQITDSVS